MSHSYASRPSGDSTSASDPTIACNSSTNREFTGMSYQD